MSDPRPGRPRRFAAVPDCWVHLARRVITRHVVGTAPEGIINGRIYRRTGTRESEERLRSGDRHQYRRSRARLRCRRLRQRRRPRHHDPDLAWLPPGTGYRPGGDQRHERSAEPGRRRRQARLEPRLVAGHDVRGRPRRARDLVSQPDGKTASIALVLLCSTLLLGGCAAGAPSIVAPAAPDSSSQVLVPAAEVTQDSDIPQAAAPDIAPESAAPSVGIQPAAVDTTTEGAGAAA